MQSFEGISFIWALVLMGVLAVVFSIRAFLAWQIIRRDAQADYAFKQSNGMLPGAIDREDYERIYRKVYNPRGPIHVAAAMIAILVITPFAMKAVEIIFELVYQLSGQSRVVEPGYLVWHFFLFFSMIAVWVGIGYLAARQYHMHAPGNLQFELDQHINGPADLSDQYPEDEEGRDIKTRLILALITAISAILVFMLRRL